MPIYSEKVMDHFTNPRNVGEIENADGIGEVGNPVCGDMMTFYIKVKDNRLEDVKYKTFGCGAAIAVSSMSASWPRARRWTKRCRLLLNPSLTNLMVYRQSNIIAAISEPRHCTQQLRITGKNRRKEGRRTQNAHG